VIDVDETSRRRIRLRRGAAALAVGLIAFLATWLLSRDVANTSSPTVENQVAPAVPGPEVGVTVTVPALNASAPTLKRRPRTPPSGSTGTAATGTSATGTAATGTSATGTSATGTAATGTAATGTSATGSAATGTSATGTSATGTSATGTSSTGGSTAGTSATGGSTAGTGTTTGSPPGGSTSTTTGG
jgi:hypothetical protein